VASSSSSSHASERYDLLGVDATTISFPMAEDVAGADVVALSFPSSVRFRRSPT
jgi:hypothetical protein